MMEIRPERLITSVMVVVFGYVTGGLMGAALGAVALWTATHDRRTVRRATATLAVVLIVLAALATLFEASRAETDLGSDYATERELAARSAQLAGTVTFALVLGAAENARSPCPTPRSDGTAKTNRGGHRSSERAPILVAAAGTVVVRALWAPTPLSPLYEEVATNIDRGIAYGRGTDFGAAETALVAPVGPVLGALAPFGARPVMVLAGAGAAAGVVALASRAGGRLVAWLAAGLSIVSPLLWAQQLPAAIASAAVTAALLALWAPGTRRARPVLAGLMLALGALARPEALLFVPVAAIWLAGREGRRRGCLLVLAAALAFSPWQLWVHRNFETWLPTTGAAHVLAAANDDEALGGSDLGSLASRALPPPGSEPAAVDVDLEAYVDQLPRSLVPHVLGARVLRSWDLWSADNAAAERRARGLPFAGGSGGAYVQAAISLLGLLGAWTQRRRWRHLGLLYLTPLAASLGAAVTFGDRALVAYAAPAMLVFAALSLSAVIPRLSATGDSTPRTRQSEASPASSL